jgi:D-serine deaminase-like pyridoxal phosphate-dependent protein
MLACADIEEGIVIRQAGVRVPILVFGALSVSDLDGLFEFALTPTISTPGAARAVQAAAARHKTTIGYHLKIDTGMNRLGFRHDNLRRTLPDLLSSANLRLESVYTHFASADVPESPVFNDQRERFESAWSVVTRSFRQPKAESPTPKAAAPRFPSRVQQRRAVARLARVVRRRASRAASLWDRPAATRIDDAAHTGDVAHQPCRRGEGTPSGEGVGYGCGIRRIRRGRLPSFLQATPTVSTLDCAGAVTS